MQSWKKTIPTYNEAISMELHDLKKCFSYWQDNYVCESQEVQLEDLEYAIQCHPANNSKF